MKASFENLQKAFEICAKAHNCEFVIDEQDNLIYYFKADSVPLYSDVSTIVEAFGGRPSDDVDEDFGWIVVYVYFLVDENGSEKLNNVNTLSLELALPYGSLQQFNDSVNPERRQVVVRKIKDARVQDVDLSRDAVVATIMKSCGLDKRSASRELSAAKRYLNDLLMSGDLQYEDIENQCYDLGLEPDYVEYFLEALGCFGLI